MAQTHWYMTLTYYINTNEKPGELSHENLISSHLKITCYLHMWKYHHCYGFIINIIAPFTPKNYESEMVWLFIGLYVINRTLHGRLEIGNFSSRVDKNISLIHWAHSWNIFQQSKRNFVSLQGHVISSIYVLSVLVSEAQMFLLAKCP